MKPVERTQRSLQNYKRSYSHIVPDKKVKRIDKRVGRNQLCTCESGKKFKNCGRLGLCPAEGTSLYNLGYQTGISGN